MQIRPAGRDGGLGGRLGSWALFGPEGALRSLARLGRRTWSGTWLREHESLRSRAAATRRGLWEVVERVEKWERPLRASRQGRRRLETFERALAAHIAREEGEGHLESVLEHAPRFDEQARRLRAEHAVLLREMRDVRTMALGADVAPDAWSDVYQAFDSLAERLRIHEEAENDIVAGALLNDLGPGD